jgi:glycosyltransferase involved in cell wall biosynthesis
LTIVSVLFPVHKESPFLSAALESLLNQDFDNFEVLFLDNSEAGINPSIWSRSSKIVHLKLPPEYGLSESLNYGVKYSNSKYVLRMDYDDIALPDRIRQQVKFMDENPYISISGTGIRFIGENIGQIETKNPELFRPENCSEIISYLLFKNPLFHPTVIMRRESLIEHDLFYNQKYDAAEDLDLWMRASHRIKISNIKLVLLEYRLHPNQFSRVDGINSKFQSAKIRVRHSIWFIFHHPAEWRKGIESLIRNMYFLALNFLPYVLRNKFNKFNQ